MRENNRSTDALICDLLMDKQAAERLLEALEQAMGSLREAHHLVLKEGGPAPMISFHDVCARIADEIDEELLVPIRGQYPEIRERAIALTREHDDPPGGIND